MIGSLSVVWYRFMIRILVVSLCICYSWLLIYDGKLYDGIFEIFFLFRGLLIYMMGFYGTRVCDIRLLF